MSAKHNSARDENDENTVAGEAGGKYTCPMHPEVVAAVEDALNRIKASGKAPGILTTSPDFAGRCLELGATFVATAIDVTLYASAIRSAAKQAKDLLNR